MTETLSAELPPAVERAIGHILHRACEAELRFATAESCTGGLIASLLTDVEGCSHAFERGFVVYTDEAKREMLCVEAGLLRRHGAVSEPGARGGGDFRSARRMAGLSRRERAISRRRDQK